MGEQAAGDRARPHRRWGTYQLEALILAVSLTLPVLIFVVMEMLRTAMPYPSVAAIHRREAGVIAALKTIQTAEVQYQSQFGRYACSLAELGPPQSGAPSALADGLIPGDLGSGERYGYRLGVACVPAGYAINAVPVSYGSSDNRSFYSDQTMIIRENDGPEPATSQSKELR